MPHTPLLTTLGLLGEPGTRTGLGCSPSQDLSDGSGSRLPWPCSCPGSSCSSGSPAQKPIESLTSWDRHTYRRSQCAVNPFLLPPPPKLQRASGGSSLPPAPPQPVQSRIEKSVSKATWIPSPSMQRQPGTRKGTEPTTGLVLAEAQLPTCWVTCTGHHFLRASAASLQNRS